MPTLIHRRVHAARLGENPTVICRIHSGWVVMGDVQFLPGYCLLLADPVVPDLNYLTRDQRQTFLYEMSVIGDALMVVTDAYRVNYEILGNSEAALHAHIFPRFLHEPDEHRQRPAWFYDWHNAPKFDLHRDAQVMQEIEAYLHSQRITISSFGKEQLPLFQLDSLS
jgi:diadenosine tetraphosphate (Ap4A) HIT family hydrolase